MSIGIGSSLVGGMSSYAYSYLGRVRPKIDKNDDALWSKNEVQNYADAYKKATGVTLDVGKLMETYGNDKGFIDAKGQANAEKDDALGLSRLYGNTAATTETAASGAMTTAQKQAISSTVERFTYTLYGELQPKLDKNDDGRWSKAELQNYADAYKNATGSSLDVNALLEKYGRDGYIDPSGQNAMKADDALGLGDLKKLLVKAATDTGTAAGSGVNRDFSLESILGSMRSADKAGFARMFQRYQTQEALLSGFMAAGGMGAFSFANTASAMNMYKFQSALYSGGSGSMYSAMSGSLMNFTI